MMEIEMTKNRLRQHRTSAYKTPAEVAAAIGVSETTYEEWEKGAKIPAKNLKSLINLFGTKKDLLLGTNEPIFASFYDRSIPIDHQYYGEISLHFVSGGKPLVLSISEAARLDFINAMENENYFISIRSLTNQLVAVRREAISDVYLCSEAHDDFGPEHSTYDYPFPYQIPDNRDWEIIHDLLLELGTDDFDKKSVKLFKELFEHNNEDCLTEISQSESETANDKVPTLSEMAINLVTDVTYQLSNGVRRELGMEDDENVFEMFEYISSYLDGSDDKFIHISDAGYHHYLYLNLSTVDFVSVPTQRYHIGKEEIGVEL